MEKLKPALYSPLVLAYIGDGVYELYVRSRLIEEHSDMPPHKLHVLSSAHVKAKAQSRAMVIVETILTEEELAIYKRGRNAKSATVPKILQHIPAVFRIPIFKLKSAMTESFLSNLLTL